MHEMEGKGVPPHEICYVAAVKACDKAGETEAAMALAGEIDALPSSSRSGSFRQRSNSSSMHAD